MQNYNYNKMTFWRFIEKSMHALDVLSRGSRSTERWQRRTEEVMTPWMLKQDKNKEY